MIWSDLEFVIHLACIIKPRILDIIWPCLLIIMIMTWLFSGILFSCALVVSFAALALRARAANDTTQAQINNIPSKSHVIPLLSKWAKIITVKPLAFPKTLDLVFKSYPVILRVWWSPETFLGLSFSCLFRMVVSCDMNIKFCAMISMMFLLPFHI